MAVNVTSEVTFAHRSLRHLCEKFETSVDEFCDSSPQSFRTQDFYECECIRIAVECVDALSKFQSACSHEVAACENKVVAADNVLRQRKHELEESVAKRAKMYENEIAAADNAFRDEVAAADDALLQRKRELKKNTDERIGMLQSEYAAIVKGVGLDISRGKNRGESSATISYNEVLGYAKHQSAWNPGRYFLVFLFAATVSTVVVVILTSGWSAIRIGGSLFGSLVSATVAIVFSHRKKNRITLVLQALRAATEKECDVRTSRKI